MRAAAILLLGPTGSGKTPLGEFLERNGFRGRACFHFDFGARLRALAASSLPPELTAADLGVIRRSLSTGALFEDDEFPVALKVFRDFMASVAAGAGDIIVLNGIPRHAGQARALSGSVDVELVVVLDAPADVVAERIGRNAEGDRGGRPDDSRAEVLKKLDIFRARTLPLVAYYSSLGIKVANVRVMADSTAADHYAALLGETVEA